MSLVLIDVSALPCCLVGALAVDSGFVLFADGFSPSAGWCHAGFTGRERRDEIFVTHFLGLLFPGPLILLLISLAYSSA